jgi:hypothetical protein
MAREINYLTLGHAKCEYLMLLCTGKPEREILAETPNAHRATKGISKETLEAWILEDPEFAEAIRLTMEDPGWAFRNILVPRVNGAAMLNDWRVLTEPRKDKSGQDILKALSPKTFETYQKVAGHLDERDTGPDWSDLFARVEIVRVQATAIQPAQTPGTTIHLPAELAYDHLHGQFDGDAAMPPRPAASHAGAHHEFLDAAG